MTSEDHEIEIENDTEGNYWWSCSCGEYGDEEPDEDSAEQDSSRHLLEVME